MAERTFSVSTDSSGVLGTPECWDDVWGFLKSDSRFVGFEMVGWRWAVSLLKAAQSRGLNVVGIHGRTGGIHDSYSFPDRIVLGTLNRLLIPTPELVSGFPANIYLLVHASELRLGENWNTIIERSGQKLIYVENHLRQGAEGAAGSIASNLRADDVNAGVMFDLFHYIRAYDHRNFAERWRSALLTLEKILNERDLNGRRIPVGLHIPIGTNSFDSLPIDEISGPMWENLAKFLKGKSVPIVIENQQHPLQTIYLPKFLRARQRTRNEKLVEVLSGNGVL